MKRLSNEFDEWDREIDRLKGLGLDDRSRFYKNLQERNWTGVTVGLIALAVVFVLFLFSLTAFG